LATVIVLGVVAGLAMWIIAGFEKPRIGVESDHPTGSGITYHTSERFCVRIRDGYYGLVELSWQPPVGPKRFDTALCLRRGIFS